MESIQVPKQVPINTFKKELPHQFKELLWR